MPLFQKSVLNKYLNNLDTKLIENKYQQFTAHFLNPTIQENIRNSKEEQYQEGFLTDLFVNILGYTKNPTPNYNLTTELKNIKDSKKVDGAIIINNVTKAVIELKGMNTTDLSTIENQAFGYKNNHPDCTYVITANFQKLRFYIDNAIEYLEYNLFTLTLEQFKELYLCLALENIEKDIPKRIKDESLTQEDTITKKLYKDYSTFKRELFDNLVQQNSEIDALTLFKKAQKLLDRFLFLFFAEDRGLLQPNSVRAIVNRWEKLKELDAYTPLIDSYRKYFGYLNTGHTSNDLVVYAYNGGLFAPDEVLDRVQLNDDLLKLHTLKIAQYDFASEIDVNILGHIFENSLNEIDEIQAELRGETVEKGKTKRKKDGVFYTPKYITKYIVDNTIGKLCIDKKIELQISEADYYSEVVATKLTKKQKEEKKNLLDKLTTYRNWLLQLTICDPACGSGAFLNQALEFLITEHRYIDELQAGLFGDAMVLTDVEGSILENNLYGVDINEESVEIAKLSLWLRTAEPNRKLTSLSNNLKCGNSLISDPTVAGEKAFNWETEFPTVFTKGGFDVVIGNPPYLRVQGIKENHNLSSIYYEEKYSTAKGRYDLYILFIELSLSKIKSEGKVSLILPHNFINTNYGDTLRKHLYNNKFAEEIIHFGSHKIFENVSTYTCILTLSYNNNFISYSSIEPKLITSNFNKEKIYYETLTENSWNLNSQSISNILSKLDFFKNRLSDVFVEIARGVVTGADDIFLLNGEIIGDRFKGFSKELNSNIEIENSLIKPILMGNSIKRFSSPKNQLYIIYPHKICKISNKTIPIPLDELEKNYPKTYSYLNNFKEILKNKKIKYKTNPEFWYALHNSRDLNIFNNQKIITPYLANKCEFTIDSCNKFITNDKCSSLILKNESHNSYNFYLGILNSKLLWFFIKNTSSEFSGGYFAFSNIFLKTFPLPEISSNSDIIISKVDTMLNLNKELQTNTLKFSKLLSSEFGLTELSKKLQDWYNLEFADVLKELKKQKIELSLTQKAEWLEFFETEKQKVNNIQNQIQATDKAIDQMVYDLYKLTPDEIEIVENS